MTRRFSVIAAVGKDNAIGNDNQLLWRIPKDMHRFRLITTGHTVIMGWRTACSLPNPLKDRTNIALTKEHRARDGFVIAHSIDEALGLAPGDDEIFFIGGMHIYAQTIPIADRMYLTEINAAPEKADAFFPEVNWSEWKETSREPAEENGLHFDFVIYNRK